MSTLSKKRKIRDEFISYMKSSLLMKTRSNKKNDSFQGKRSLKYEGSNKIFYFWVLSFIFSSKFKKLDLFYQLHVTSLSFYWSCSFFKRKLYGITFETRNMKISQIRYKHRKGTYGRLLCCKKYLYKNCLTIRI